MNPESMRPERPVSLFENRGGLGPGRRGWRITRRALQRFSRSAGLRPIATRPTGNFSLNLCAPHGQVAAAHRELRSVLVAPFPLCAWARVRIGFSQNHTIPFRVVRMVRGLTFRIRWPLSSVGDTQPPLSWRLGASTLRIRQSGVVLASALYPRKKEFW